MSNIFKDPWVRVGPYADNLLKELLRELGPGHPLWGRGLRAVAQRTDSDDVLFEVSGVEPLYAVVHLTWSGKPESDPNFPDVKTFASMDHWIREGMMQDHAEFMS
jgi:hypothetical protein